MPIGNEPIPGENSAPDNPITSQNLDSVVQSPPASNTMNPEAPRPTVGMNPETAPVIPAELMENVPAEKRPLIRKIVDRLGATKDAILNTSGNALRKLGSYGKDNWQDYAGTIGGVYAGRVLVASGVGAAGVAGAATVTLLFRNFIEPKFHSRALGKAEEKYTGQQLVEKVEKIKGKHDKIQRFTANAAVAVVIGGILRGTGADKAISSFLGDRASDLGSAVHAVTDAAGSAAGEAAQNTGSALFGTDTTINHGLPPAPTPVEGSYFIHEPGLIDKAGDALGNATHGGLDKVGEGLGNIKSAVLGGDHTLATESGGASHTTIVHEPGLVDKALDTAGNVKDNAISGLGNLKDTAGNNLGPAAQNAADTLGGIKDSALEKAGEAKDAAGNALFGEHETMYTGGQYENIEVKPGIVDNALSGAKQFAGDRVSDLGSGVRAFGDNAAGPAANNAVEGLKNVAGQGVDFVGDRLGDAGNAAKDFASDHTGEIVAGAAVGGAYVVGKEVGEREVRKQVLQAVGADERRGFFGNLLGRLIGKKPQQ